MRQSSPNICAESVRPAITTHIAIIDGFLANFALLSTFMRHNEATGTHHFEQQEAISDCSISTHRVRRFPQGIISNLK
jgi:hypothetical protein